MWVTIVAVSIANLLAAINQVGWVLQKKSMTATNNKRCIWLCGFGFMIIAAVGLIFILPFADLTLLSTTNATGIITGVLLGIFWLKEPFNLKVDLPALILMLSGAVALGCLT